MVAYKGFIVRIYPDVEQQAYLNNSFEVSRKAYNLLVSLLRARYIKGEQPRNKN